MKAMVSAVVVASMFAFGYDYGLTDIFKLDLDIKIVLHMFKLNMKAKNVNLFWGKPLA